MPTDNRPGAPKRAQALSEIAIFGAVLIFVIGGIMRTGLQFSEGMNQQLKAMRMAMAESYRTAQGAYSSGVPSAARNAGSILLIEDRLSVDAGSKFDTRDRVPFVISGSGSMSENYFLPIDPGDHENLPLYDLYVNGQRFPLLTARFKNVDTSASAWSANKCTDAGAKPPCWEDNCMTKSTTEIDETEQQCLVNSINTWVPDDVCCTGHGLPSGTVNCSDTTAADFTACRDSCSGVKIGCLMMLRTSINIKDDTEWCWDKTAGCNNSNLPVDDRFDLDVDGSTDVLETDQGMDQDGNTVSLRQVFMWQWYLVPAVDFDSASRIDYPIYKGLVTKGAKGIRIAGDDGEEVNTLVDVDGDFKEETIKTFVANKEGVITTINVTDSQDGDIDFGQTDFDKENFGKWVYSGSSAAGSCGTTPAGIGFCTPLSTESSPNIIEADDGTGTCIKWECKSITPGLQDDIQMYSRTNNGTVLRIEEGKLFDPNGDRFIRTTNRNDHVDIIQRIFQLSNDTHRFCNASGNVVNWAASPYAVRGIRNPVEACNHCFSAANMEKTCMDQALKQIFIRSRLEDLRGRRWVTRFQEP